MKDRMLSSQLNDEKPLRLVMGMSRGGTTSVLRALNLRGDVAAFGETGFWSLKEANPRNGMLNKAQITRVSEIYANVRLFPVQDGEGSIGVAQEEISRAVVEGISRVTAPADTLTVFKALGDAVAQVSGCSDWVEKTPHHLMHIDHILRCAPTAKIIVMLRSPEAFLNSYKHQGDRKQDIVRRNFHRLYHPALASLICRGYLKAALAAQQKYPGNVMIIRLEDVRADETGVLEKVMNHFQFSDDRVTEIPLSNSSFSGDAQRSPLQSVESMWLRLLAGSVAVRLGYEISKMPRRPTELVGSVLRLAAWPFVNLQMLFSLRAGPIRVARRWLR